MKEPRSDFRPQEEEYFRKQDAELIERLKEERAEQAKRQALNELKLHCTSCGLDTVAIATAYQGAESHGDMWSGAHVCVGCHQVSLPFAGLQKLMFNKNGRLLCQDLHDQVLIPLKSKSGRKRA